MWDNRMKGKHFSKMDCHGMKDIDYFKTIDDRFDLREQ